MGSLEGQPKGQFPGRWRYEALNSIVRLKAMRISRACPWWRIVLFVLGCRLKKPFMKWESRAHTREWVTEEEREKLYVYFKSIASQNKQHDDGHQHS